VLSSDSIDPCLLVCTAFFITGLQPHGCTKQLIRVQAGRPYAWANRLQAHRPAPSKIMRTPRRPFKSWRSRSHERSQFGVNSTRGQPHGKVFMVRPDRDNAEPRRGPIQATRSGCWCRGAWRARRPNGCGTLRRTRPWRALVRRSGSPARSAKFLTMQASGLLRSVLSCISPPAGRSQRSSQGTSWCRRWHNSNTAACSSR
jgi:hypothetical protein